MKIQIYKGIVEFLRENNFIVIINEFKDDDRKIFLEFYTHEFYRIEGNGDNTTSAYFAIHFDDSSVSLRRYGDGNHSYGRARHFDLADPNFFDNLLQCIDEFME